MKNQLKTSLCMCIVCLLPACGTNKMLHDIGRLAHEKIFTNSKQRTALVSDQVNAILSSTGSTKMAILTRAGTNIQHKIKRISVSGNETVLELDFIAKKQWGYGQFFNIGKYNLANDKGGAAFIVFVTETLKKIVDVLQDQASLRFQITYQGGADGLKVKPRSIAYQGEFGDVNIAEAKLNDRILYNVKYRKNDYIDNKDLAMLRAYSAMYLFKIYANKIGGLENVFDRPKIIATTYDQKGHEHRFVRVTIVVKTKHARNE